MYTTYKELLLLIVRNKRLILELAKREFSDRYAGQVLGKLWVIIHPALLMFVYLFVFVAVFKVKIQDTISLSNDYPTYLLSGLIAWLIVQEVLSKSTVIVTSNANLVKQVIFPLEVLPLKTVLASLLTMLLFIGILFIYTVFFQRSYSFMLLILPLLIYLHVIFMIGIAFILSAIGVYFKDMKDIIQMFSVVGVFLLPIMYLPSQIPSLFEPLLYANPFSYLVFCYQDVFFYGKFEHWYAWIIMFTMGHITLFGGYVFFKKLKVMFGNVL